MRQWRSWTAGAAGRPRAPMRSIAPAIDDAQDPESPDIRRTQGRICIVQPVVKGY